jgi:hypothetical protein
MSISASRIAAPAAALLVCLCCNINSMIMCLSVASLAALLLFITPCTWFMNVVVLEHVQKGDKLLTSD